MAPVQRFQTFRQNQVRWGIPRALHMQVMSALAIRFGFYLSVLNLRTLTPVAAIPPMPEGYIARQLTADDYLWVTREPALEMSEAFVAQARSNGDFCVGAFCEGALVSYLWRGFERVAVTDELMLEIKRPIRYGYKALTLPGHRGQRLQHTLALMSDAQCLEMGYTQSVSYIETHNFASRKSDARRGNKVIGYLAWIAPGPPGWHWASPGAKRYGIALRRSPAAKQR